MRYPKGEFKRLVRYCMVLLLLGVLTAAFYWAWNTEYHDYTLYRYQSNGNVLIVFLYGVLIFLLTYSMGGAKYGLLKRANISFSQSVAAVLTNFCFYFVIVLLAARILAVWPFLLLTIFDVLFIVLWNSVSYRLLVVLFPPRKLLIVRAAYNSYQFEQKLNSRNDKYEISKVVSLEEYADLKERGELKEYGGIVLFDIPAVDRNAILKYCYQNSIRVYTTLKISDILMRNAEELNLFDTQLALVREYNLTFEQKFLKRLLDIVISVVGLVLASPMMLITAICIKAYDGGTVFFTQERCTLNGKVFKIHKFRSMIMNAEKPGQVIPATDGDPRITPIGRFIRATRIDELPQLFDILIGNMSLVGPRPERVEHVEKYTAEIPEFPMRLQVKAGLTGYAQVFGKYNTNPYDKLKLDLTYIANYSILMDIKIILLTIMTVFSKESTEGFQKETKEK